MRGSRSSFATACCSASLAVACARGGGDAGRDGSARAAQEAAIATSDGGGARSSDASAAQTYATADPVRAKSIGHTSYVLKLTLEGGRVVVYKPRSKLPLGDHRYKGEIAAYRLATALGLDNVQPAMPRAFAADTLRAVVDGFDAKGRVDDDGMVRGALMPWLDTYRVLPLEEDAWRKQWEPWVLAPHASIPDSERARAASISTMIVFDYLTANWDRWSGGNVAEDSATGKVLFVDNDGAFYEAPDPALLKRQLAFVQRVARFSRRFVAALRGLDAATIGAALGDEYPGVPLVSARVVDGVDARRRAAIDAIDARVRDAGDGATLAFE